jgi:hypothetical protein
MPDSTSQESAAPTAMNAPEGLEEGAVQGVASPVCHADGDESTRPPLSVTTSPISGSNWIRGLRPLSVKAKRAKPVTRPIGMLKAELHRR